MLPVIGNKLIKQSYHAKQWKDKQHNDMTTQENQTGKKPKEDLT